MRGGPATARAAATLACPPSDPVPAASAAFSTLVLAMVGSGVEPRERARDAAVLLGAWAGLDLAEAVDGRAAEEGLAALGVTTADSGMAAHVSFAGASLLGAGWFTGAACGSWAWGAVGLTGAGAGRERLSPSGVDGAEDVGTGAGSVGLELWDAGVVVGSEACALCDDRPNTIALPFLAAPAAVSGACDAAVSLVVPVSLRSSSVLAGSGAAVAPALAELVMGILPAGLGSLQAATRPRVWCQDTGLRVQGVESGLDEACMGSYQLNLCV